MDILIDARTLINICTANFGRALHRDGGAARRADAAAPLVLPLLCANGAGDERRAVASVARSDQDKQSTAINR